MATVTAIIPTFNRALLACECVESLLAQSHAVDEIIVVDDGSSDGTAEVLARFGARITLISKPNGGKSSALNLGLERAAGDLVWICDDDDLAHRDGLRNLYRVLEAHPDAPFSYGHFEPFEDVDGERRFGPRSERGRETEEDSFLITSLEQMTAFQFATLARRESYSRTGPFREDLVRSQDFDMLIRLARLGRPAYVPETIFYQRQHSGQRGSATANFGSDDAYDRAITYSGRIMRALRDDLPLDAYTPHFAHSWTDALAKKRAALLQRGLIYAQRAQWPEAAEDLAAAAALAAGRAATEQERVLGGRVVRDLKPWPILARDPASLRALVRIRKSGSWGAAIVSEMGAALEWLARSLLRAGQIREGLHSARLYLQLAGVRGACAHVAGKALGRPA